MIYEIFALMFMQVIGNPWYFLGCAVADKLEQGVIVTMLSIFMGVIGFIGIGAMRGDWLS